MSTIVYETSATALGGRDGTVRTEDGLLDVAVKMPKELGGPGGATNPEQLFAAGYAACFLSALKLVAGQKKVSLPQDAQISAKVGLGKGDDGFSLVVDLTAVLPGLDAETTDALLEAAHEVCPYSKATRGNIAVSLTAG